jgi:hypothetical protein
MYGEYFLESCFKRIQERLDAVKDSVVSGALNNMEDYRFSVGRLRTYQECIDILKECYSHCYESKTIYSGRDENGDEQFEN